MTFSLGKQGERIRFLVMDVDGTLTDGKIYIGPSGEAMKAFDVKDGYAIYARLPEMGIIPVIITARQSEIVLLRCNELGIEEVYQTATDKKACLQAVLDRWSENEGRQYSFGNVAYIGDDVLDLQCMIPVKQAGGIVACPADAALEVRDIATYICNRAGGDGAVRELVDHLRSCEIQYRDAGDNQ